MKLIRKIKLAVLLVAIGIVVLFAGISLEHFVKVYQQIRNTEIPPLLTRSEVSVIAQAIPIKLPESVKEFKTYFWKEGHSTGHIYCLIVFDCNEFEQFQTENSLNVDPPIDTWVLQRNLLKPLRRTGIFGKIEQIEWWTPSENYMKFAIKKSVPNNLADCADILLEQHPTGTINVYAARGALRDNFPEEFKEIFPQKYGWDMRKWCPEVLPKNTDTLK